MATPVPTAKRRTPGRLTSLTVGALAFALALAAGMGLGRDGGQAQSPHRAPAKTPGRAEHPPLEIAASTTRDAGGAPSAAPSPSLEDARWAALDPKVLERPRDPRKVPDIFVVVEDAPPKPPAPPPQVKASKPPAPTPPVILASPAPDPPAPPPAPRAPPLPFRYVGELQEADTGHRAFLARQDQSFAVRVGDRIESTYEVLSIERAEIVLKYLPLGIEQRLAR